MFPYQSNRKQAAPQILRSLSVAVCERQGELREARQTLNAERAEEGLLRVSGGEVDEALRRAIEGLRDVVWTLGGRGAIVAIGLSGPIPYDPDGLLKMAQRLVRTLRQPLPKALQVSGRALDAGCTADRINALARRLELERDALADQRQRVGEARRTLNTSLSRYEAELASAVAVMVGLKDGGGGSSGPARLQL